MKSSLYYLCYLRSYNHCRLYKSHGNTSQPKANRRMPIPIWNAPRLLILLPKQPDDDISSTENSFTYTRAFWVTTLDLSGKPRGGFPGNVILWETQRVSGWPLFRALPTSSRLAFQKAKCHSDMITHTSTLPTLRPSNWTVLSLASSLFIMVDFRFSPVRCNTTGTACFEILRLAI